MKLTSFRDTIKKQKSPFTKAAYRGYKNIHKLSISVPRPVAGFFYYERNIRRQTWKWFCNKFYYEPMMRYICTSVGRNFKTDGDLPLVVGSGKIFIRDHVKIGNRCAFVVSANLFEQPELIIGSHTVINYMSGVSVEKRVEIGDHCMLAGETMIFDNNSHGLDYTTGRKMTRDDVAPVKIEDHVWIGMRSLILKGVTIGKGSVVAACSVVTNDVPPMTLVGGNPARAIKEIASGDNLT